MEYEDVRSHIQIVVDDNNMHKGKISNLEDDIKKKVIRI